VSSARSAPPATHVRPFEHRDLDAAVEVWTEATAKSQPPVFPLAEVVNALGADHVALVAETDGALTGAIVAHLQHDPRGSCASGCCPVREARVSTGRGSMP